MALSSNVTAPSLVEWRQSCLSYVPCLDCWVVWRAVAAKEINHNQLKAGIDGNQSSKVETAHRDCPGVEAGSRYQRNRP